MDMAIGCVKMKTKSLKLRLIASFMIIIFIFACIMAFFLVQAFKKYYYEDVYRTLEENANSWVEKINISKVKDRMTTDEFMKIGEKDIRKIEEMYWFETKDSKIIRKSTDKIRSHFTETILVKIEENMRNQTETVKRYEMVVRDRTLFYVIAKYRNNTKNITLINNHLNKNILIKKNQFQPAWSYRVLLKWKTEDETFLEKLYTQGVVIFILVIITMFFISVYLSRYLIKPLIRLKSGVENISNRKLDKPIEMNRDDEIGFLANSIEQMRKELLKYDEDQKFKLHAISHELKTPIMAMKSYLEALKNGLYPKGSLDASLEVIDEECERLENLVYNILYIQRLDYLDTEIKARKKINLKDLIEEEMNTFAIQLKEIDVEMCLDEVWIHSNDEQLKMIVRNILNNQIRHVKTKIKVFLKQDKEKIYLNFFNDGEKIENTEAIFELFKKGKNGKSGMGLYIVSRLLKMNKGNIVAMNEENGVSFQIEMLKS